MVISCEYYEALCFLSSVGSERLVYTEEVTGSNPVESTTVHKGYMSWSEIYSRKLNTLS